MAEDWEGEELLVCPTDDDHIVLRFPMATLEREPGLVAYMNILASTHEVIIAHGLRKVVEDWNVTPGDGFLYFTFRPPWVRVRVHEAFYALHPEERAFKRPEGGDGVVN